MRQREWGDKSLRQSAGLRGIGLPPVAVIVLVFSFILSSSPTECGIPLLHEVRVGGDRDKSKTCTHFSEIVSPSHGEVVAAKHFVLHVRCLAECGVTGAHVKIYLNEEMHPDAAVELFCQEGSASMKHIVITQPPPGLWTATIKTYRGSKLLDTRPFSMSFIIIDAPAPVDASTQLRAEPWDHPAQAHQVWGKAWGDRLAAGYARCASHTDQVLQRCVLSNAMAANGTFWMWASPEVVDASNHVGPLLLRSPDTLGFSLYACPGGQKSSCWGAPAAVDVRYLLDTHHSNTLGVCDTVVKGSSLLFSLPYLGSSLSFYMAGLVAIVATLHDPDLPALTGRAEVGVLISNAAPPVEGVLGPYLALLKTLTGGKALVSLTELSMQGTVCFERLFVGMQQVQHMSSEHSAPDAASAPAAMWWEAVEGGVRAHLSRTRRLVMQGLDVDGSLARRFTGELRVLLAVRDGRLNREWFDVAALVQAAQSVKGVRALTARLTLTHTPDETKVGDGWGPEWSSDLTSSHLSSSGQSPELVAPGSKEALHLLLSRLQNISVLLGVTGDALASALWMAPGTLLIQILPYGVKNHYGREYAVLGHAGPGNYMQIELPASSAAFYPWTPHPTATSDSHLYWQQDPSGAALLYMQAGGLQMDKDAVVSLMHRAVKMVGARHLHQAHDQQESDTKMGAADNNGLGFDAASMSLSWHSADGAVDLLPPRGQFA